MHILHVEDDLDIQEIARMSLEMVGQFSITQCDSGEAALARAKDMTPDLLLLDVMMPGMTGPETLQRLREMDHLKDVPAIYMTARVQPGEIEGFKQTGALGVIEKPFDPVTLSQQITTMMGR